MDELNDIANLILNENAYFLRKRTDSYLSNAFIEELFKKASVEKEGRYLLKEINKELTLATNLIRYSICVFRYVREPTFIKEPRAGWKEIKLAYMLIADYKDLTFITRKNVAGIDNLLDKHLAEVEYNLLSTLFVNDKTTFEKISMNNTSITIESIRGKSIEAIDLKNSMPTLGLGKYVPTSMRVNNDDEKTAITFNTSRIMKYGAKKEIPALLEWAYNVIETIRHHSHTTSFLDVFSTPVEWSDFRDNLVPSSILFNLIKLHTDIDSGKIQSIYYKEPDDSKTVIDPNTLVSSLLSVLNIEKRSANNIDKYYITGLFDNSIRVNLNAKSISLYWDAPRKIYLELDEGSPENLTNYLTRNNYYIINFDSVEYIYTMKHLYKDSSLLGYVDIFLDVFKPHHDLVNMLSEKGIDSGNSSVRFCNDSLFGFIEDKLMPDSDFTILDDLGDEWADYILLKDNRIQFVHAKHNTSTASASAFQDIVSQALKNIGNFTASDDRIEKKKSGIWSETYNLNSINTGINRLRKGDNINNAISHFLKLTKDPNLIREVVLVVSFISKSDLTNWLTRLKLGEQFGERKQIIQILWLISCLINACVESGVSIHIYCRD